MSITVDILRYEEGDGTALVEKVKDTAGQKGTGKWTVISALDNGVPVTTVCKALLLWRCW